MRLLTGNMLIVVVMFSSFFLSLSQGLRKRQVDMIEDGVCGSSQSLTRVTTLLREICGKAVRRLEIRRKMRIGGRRAFVAIDESKFRHKRKVRSGFVSKMVMTV